MKDTHDEAARGDELLDRVAAMLHKARRPIQRLSEMPLAVYFGAAITC